MLYRQGELIIKGMNGIPKEVKKRKGKILAEGEVTSHKHIITEGEAELYEKDGQLYLSVKSDKAILTHPDHKPLALPKGKYIVTSQREYEISEERYRKVVD